MLLASRFRQLLNNSSHNNQQLHNNSQQLLNNSQQLINNNSHQLLNNSQLTATQGCQPGHRKGKYIDIFGPPAADYTYSMYSV